MEKIPVIPLEERLNSILIETNGPIYVSTLLQMLAGKGLPLIVILLSLPFSQPIQIPGVSTPFGLLVGFLGLRMAFGKRIWLPRSIVRKQLPKEAVKKTATHALWLIKKIKRFCHPRLTLLFSYPLAHVFNGLLIFFLGLFLALPLPIPFTNLVAGWALLCMSLGILEDDGLFLIAGYLAASICLGFVVSLFYFIA